MRGEREGESEKKEGKRGKQRQSVLRAKWRLLRKRDPKSEETENRLKESATSHQPKIAPTTFAGSMTHSQASIVITEGLRGTRRERSERNRERKGRRATLESSATPT